MAVKNKNAANGATEEMSEKGGTEVASTCTTRPLTRQFLAEQERLRKEKEARENQPRRSDRDHDVSSSGLVSLCMRTDSPLIYFVFIYCQCIRVKGADPFYWRLEALFFQPVSKANLQTLIGKRLPIRPLHLRPHIYDIDNFLTQTELDYFDQFIKKCSFQKSFVDNMEFEDGDTAPSPDEKSSKRRRRTLVDSSHRTSTFFSFKHRANATIRSIEQRTANLLGCWVHQLEGLQLVRYKPGEFFGVHHDLGDLLEDDQVLLPRKQFAVKRRLVTLFVYLNDLKPNNGGATHFPKCGDLRVTPKKGNAVLWSNVTADGSPDPATIHAGEAVQSTSKDGNDIEKYGLNIWVTEK
jgi:hypothetical protein